MLKKVIPCCLVLSILIFYFTPSISSDNKDSFLLPYIQLNEIISSSFLADLDVRDSQNRPIKSASAKYELYNLFRSGLYSLVVESELHSSIPILAVIRRILQLGENFIARNIERIFIQPVQAILPQIKKISVLFVLLILGSVLLGTQITYSSFFSHLFFTPETKVAPLVLRC